MFRRRPRPRLLVQGVEPSNRQLEVKGHVRYYKDADGATHEQHLGPEHVVKGSERVYELAPGESFVIRHFG